MTGKELMYIEDALSHEEFMKTCAPKTSNMLQDPALAGYIGGLEKKHTEIYNKFLNLL